METTRKKKSVSALKRKYEMFHGRKVKNVSRTNFHIPDYLVYLGEANAIEYVSDKFNGGGDGKEAIYRHIFDTPVKLYMDERCGKQLYLLGSKLKVTKAGIEN